LAALVYEGVVLFGVVMVTGMLHSTLSHQSHILGATWSLQLALFTVLGIYFVWFWSHGGQTVAMKAWHIRLQGPGGGGVSKPRALARYLLAWLWFMPALASIRIVGLSGGLAVTASLLTGVMAYAALARLRPDRQFLHDVVCGTRLVDCRERNDR
jgi:uncharacterized RDD family membrane protein YckC